MNWILLTNKQQIDQLKELSNQKAVIVFKNSPRCYISKFSLKNFERTFINSTQTPCYMVDVIANRPESQYIASEFNVEHQSPQLLIIYKQEVVFDCSHENIDPSQIQKLLLRI
ncbi:bacillithiol system redox-active protein YtxJ [Myroides sp. LJL110]